MASTIDQLCNNLGFLYETDQALNITAVRENSKVGIRDILLHGACNSPIAASRGAISFITIDDVASTGAFSAINVSGVNQIGSNVNVTTSNPATEAIALANAINLFTPGSGPDFRAVAVGAVVYLLEPASVAGQFNGVTPVVSVTDLSIQTTVTAFAGGATPSGAYDKQFGRLYWLDANASAVPNSIAGALDVTKYLTLRGLNTGLPIFESTISGDQILSVDRYSAFIKIKLLNESGAGRDNLEFINPNGFIEGDVLFLAASVDSQLQDVISAPNATLPNANIYLTDDAQFPSDNNAILMVQYTYDDALGAIFREISRSNPASAVSIPRYNKIYVDLLGDDATALRTEFTKPFQNIDAAVVVASDGDTIDLGAGTQTATVNVLAHNNFTIITRGDTYLTGINILTSIGSGSKIVGDGTLDTNIIASVPGANSAIEVFNFTLGQSQQLATNNFIVNVTGTLTVKAFVIWQSSAHNTRWTWNRAVFTNQASSPGISCFQWTDPAAGGSVYLKGDVYVTNNYDNIFYSAPKSLFHGWQGRLFITAGVSINSIFKNIGNKPTDPKYRFRISDFEIYSPVDALVFNTFGDAEMEASNGKVFASGLSSYVGNADRDSGGINLPSNLYFKNVQIFSEGTSVRPLNLADTASRIILDDVSIYSQSATNCINGAVAACFYQNKGAYSNKPVGGNASQELSAPFEDIFVDAAMKQ